MPIYYRTSHGEEIDLIVDRKQYQELIEIKNSETFRPKMLSAIEKFLVKGNQGYLLYNGKEFTYSKEIKIINYKDYCLTSL